MITSDAQASTVRPDERAAQGSRLPSLTGLRALAAFLVFGVHVAISGLFEPGSAQHALSRAFGAGAVGVSFFFILSGFVLTWSARPGDTPRAFWRRRAVKIYPVYVIALVVSIVGLVAASLPAGPRETVPALFLVQSWWPSPDVHFGANSVSWSLSDEAFFYALFPWLCMALSRLRRDRLTHWAAVCVAGVLSVPMAASWLPSGRRYWFVYVFPPVRLLEFVLGILVALAVKGGHWPRVPVWVAGTAVALAYVVTPYAPVDAETSAVTVIPFALLVAAVAQADVEGRRSVWAGRRLVWLGEVSFAFYLVHQSAILDVMRGLGAQGSSAAMGAALTLFSLALSVGLAALLHRYVEVPMVRWYSHGDSNPVPRGENPAS
jgi:peptidoglycan/LPS O-acetylase OafA/YrhL